MGLGGLVETVWPVISSADSDSQRRKKLAVRGGHLAMVAMVAIAVTGTILADFPRLTRSRVFGLVAVAVVYMGWSLLGTRDAIRLLLWEGGTPQPLPARTPGYGIVLYFVGQVALAGLVYYLGDVGHEPNLVWLALLPPVAYSVFILERTGIVVVSGLTLGIFVLNVVQRHGWAGVPYALMAFSFAWLFTLVFALLVVSAERSRIQVQQLAEELGAANLKLRTYAVQVEELAVARERNRIAREIHDSLGHYLTVVNVQIRAAQALQESDPARARHAMEKAQALTQEGLQDIRRSVATLRASPLHNRLLAEALREMIQESRTTGLETEFQVRGEPRPLSPPAALALYRAGQEGLTNVCKHARATRVALVLDFSLPAQVSLRVTDDGCGTPAESPASTGFGLLGLRERVQLLGGEVRVRATPGAGFSLEVEVPG